MVNLPDIKRLNIDYVKTPQGILKILQIVLLLIAFSCITDCCNGGGPYVSAGHSYWFIVLRKSYPPGQVFGTDLTSYPRNVSFFLAVTILGWMFVVFYFLVFFFKFHERFSHIEWKMMVMITSIVWSVLLLLSCSLMGSIANTANSGKTAAVNGSNGTVYLFLGKWVAKMATGVVFGFFSMIAFIVDAVLLFKVFWEKRKNNDSRSTDNTGVTTVSESQGQPGQDQPQPQYPPGQLGQHQTQPQYPPGQPGQHQTQPQYPPGQLGQHQAQPQYPPGQPGQHQTQTQYPPGQPGQHQTQTQYPSGQPGQHQTQTQYPPGQTFQAPSGQNLQASPQQTVPNLPGQPVPNSSGGEAVVMYPRGQQL